MDKIAFQEIKGFYYHIFKTKFKALKTSSIPIIICDNVSIHKSSKIQELIEDSGITILTIIPYTQRLKPTEHLIGSIKSKIKQQLNHGM